MPGPSREDPAAADTPGSISAISSSMPSTSSLRESIRSPYQPRRQKVLHIGAAIGQLAHMSPLQRARHVHRRQRRPLAAAVQHEQERIDGDTATGAQVERALRRIHRRGALIDQEQRPSSCAPTAPHAARPTRRPCSPRSRRNARARHREAPAPAPPPPRRRPRAPEPPAAPAPSLRRKVRPRRSGRASTSSMRRGFFTPMSWAMSPNCRSKSSSSVRSPSPWAACAAKQGDRAFARAPAAAHHRQQKALRRRALRDSPPKPRSFQKPPTPMRPHRGKRLRQRPSSADGAARA